MVISLPRQQETQFLATNLSAMILPACMDCIILNGLWQEVLDTLIFLVVKESSANSTTASVPVMDDGVEITYVAQVDILCDNVLRAISSRAQLRDFLVPSGVSELQDFLTR